MRARNRCKTQACCTGSSGGALRGGQGARCQRLSTPAAPPHARRQHQRAQTGGGITRLSARQPFGTSQMQPAQGCQRRWVHQVHHDQPTRARAQRILGTGQHLGRAGGVDDNQVGRVRPLRDSLRIQPITAPAQPQPDRCALCHRPKRQNPPRSPAKFMRPPRRKGQKLRDMRLGQSLQRHAASINVLLMF